MSVRPITEALEDRLLMRSGTLDWSFGNGGTKTFSFAGGEVQQVAVQVYGDGRVLSIDHYIADGQSASRLALERFDADGTPDTTYGTDGQLITDINGNVHDALLQSDGRLLVADGADGLYRLNVDGSRDKHFGTKGKMRLDADDVELSNTGQIYLLSSVRTNATDLDVTVRRVNGNGTFDNSFGTPILDNAAGLFGKDLSIAPDGSLFASTTTNDVFHVKTDGSDDQVFNDSADLSGHGTSVVAVAATNTGVDLVIDNGNIAQIDNAGDVAFATPALGRTVFATNAFRQSDGKLIVTGFTRAQVRGEPAGTYNYSALLWRLNPDASVDTTFNGQGSQHNAASRGAEIAATTGPDGAIVTASTSLEVPSLQLTSATLASVSRIWRDDAPLAQLNSTTLRKTNPVLNFSVTYRDPTAVKQETFDGNDIRLYQPDGTFLRAEVVKIDPAVKSTNIYKRTVHYRVLLPSGNWTSAQNGEYRVKLMGGQVSDLNGDFIADRTLGFLHVAIA
jgi:uncharacterized delta-60 repeat protein